MADEVQTSKEDGMYMVRLSGRPDVASDEAKSTIDGLLGENSSEKLPVLVDFSQITGMNSSGVGLLFYLLTESEKRGVPVRFFRVNDLTQKVLTVAGMEDIVAIYPDEAAARAG